MILSQDEINILLDYFLSNNKKYSFTMNMCKINWSDIDDTKIFDTVNSIIKKLGFSNYTIIGDNYFSHSKSYFPHCDLIDNADFNILIPLKLIKPIEDQKFIIFDQKWLGSSQTWIGNLKTDKNFLYNKLTVSRPCDSELLTYNTHKPCPQYIIDNMDMTYLDNEYLFGLSGKVIDWIPGHVIVFDSRHIHATGKMNCESKIGLSIRIKLK